MISMMTGIAVGKNYNDLRVQCDCMRYCNPMMILRSPNVELVSPVVQ